MEKTKLNTVEIHGNPYVMVKDRLMEFHRLYPNGSIVTTKSNEDGDKIEFKATVVPDVASTPIRAFTGHSEAVRASGKGITGQSPVEVAETSAVGRALGMLGIGILESVASGDEINKSAGFAMNRGPVVNNPVSGSVLCKCDEPAKKLFVKKEGPNKGKAFYACAKPKASQCDFFIFEDQIPSRKDDDIEMDEDEANEALATLSYGD